MPHGRRLPRRPLDVRRLLRRPHLGDRVGEVGDVDVGGLSAALVYSYDDDEAGSPWSVALHVDARSDDQQRAALQWLFLDGLHQLPWIRKARHLIGVQTSTVEIDGTKVRARHGRDGRGDARASRPRCRSRCGIPGYERAGHELYADEPSCTTARSTGSCTATARTPRISTTPRRNIPGHARPPLVHRGRRREPPARRGPVRAPRRLRARPAGDGAAGVPGTAAAEAAARNARPGDGRATPTSSRSSARSRRSTASPARWRRACGSSRRSSRMSTAATRRASGRRRATAPTCASASARCPASAR